MADQRNPNTGSPMDTDPAREQDFQFVLGALLSAYAPVLEEELNRAKHPAELEKEAAAHPPNCEDEIALANRIFGEFLNEKVALSILPPQGRDTLGAVDNWRWCLIHLRCCLIFGWLVCRGPRNFRAFTYYLYRYWRCVRETLGTPVGTPPTAAELADYTTLVEALARAFRPYLTDQLASVEFPAGIPEEVIGGRIDCREGLPEICEIFERLFGPKTALALLGEKAFAEHSRAPWFWFCRCWCLCAICFGCCLARARTMVEVRWCLKYFFKCLAECFQPLRCELTDPDGCVQERPGLVKEAVAVEIKGTAAGAFFDHYTLEWRQAHPTTEPCDNQDKDWQNGSTKLIHYPGGGSSGTVPVVNGTLGWLDTTDLQTGFYEIRVCVYSSLPETPRTCCCHVFQLFKALVWIDRVADLPGAMVKTPPGWFDQSLPPQSPIVDTAGNTVSVGGCVSVIGTAWVGDCPDRKIKCVDLRAAVGWLPGTAEPGFAATLPLYTTPMLPAPICYTDAVPLVEIKKRASWNQLFERPLTARWVPTVIPPFDTQFCLQRYCFNSADLLPPCPDAQHDCHSGKYTILLDVTDTMDNHYYDTQQVWFDNKYMYANVHVAFDGFAGLAACADLHLGPDSRFVPPGAPCGIPWPANLLGVAYDEYIDPADLSSPSDNFDYYSLSVTKQGGITYSVPITPALGPPAYGPDPFKGTQRVGDPGTRCEILNPIPGCPPPLVPARTPGLLTKLDMRIFDAVCAASIPVGDPSRPPAGFPLKRGECCGYSFQLYAQDRTWSDGWAGGFHHNWSSPWAICICNDLPPEEHG
jgi:hypothetical protein